MESLQLIKKIAFISTFPPRQCRIATFTKSLIDELTKSNPLLSTVVIAVNDLAGAYNYPEVVQYEINENEYSTYLQAADYVNVNQFDIVCIQQELKCLGEDNTTNLLSLSEHLRTPVIICFPTTICNPNELPYKYIERLGLLSAHFVVSTQMAREVLEKAFSIRNPDIEIIHPGMTLQEAAQKYLHSFETTRLNFGKHLLNKQNRFNVSNGFNTLPQLKLNHLIRMTDSTGILQHAKYSFPDYSEGYCTDDNARALILALLMNQLYKNSRWLDHLKSRTIGFLNYALNRKTFRFRNFFGYNREWLDEQGSEDSHGRALWALGCCISKSNDLDLQDIANQLFKAALKSVGEFSNARSWSFILLGINEYLKRFPDDRICKRIEIELSDRIIKMFSHNSSFDWPWCEEIITYDNARITQGILNCGYRTKRNDLIDTALHSLRWLVQIQTAEEGHFRAIGSNGFFKRGSTIAQFDQQPIEASAMISSCIEAFKITGDYDWVKSSRTIFSWFLGKNDLGLALYDETSGGCRDALHADRVNRNQGAESTLSFLTSLIEMNLLEKYLPI